MTAWRRIRATALLVVLAGPAPAHAEVIAQTDLGFVSRNVVVVAGSAMEVWKRLVTPAAWWLSDHTFSGDAANLTLDSVPGGCFCENLPQDDAEAGNAAKPSPAPRPPMPQSASSSSRSSAPPPDWQSSRYRLAASTGGQPQA